MKTLNFAKRNTLEVKEVNLPSAQFWAKDRLFGNWPVSDENTKKIEFVETCNGVDIAKYGDGSYQIEFKGSFTSLAFDIAPKDAELLIKESI